MRIREIRFNIQFEYIKEIRKYLYDIEDFLKQKKICETVNPVPPLPDDFEPQIERFNCIKTEDNKTINIFISQTYISILFAYTASLHVKEVFKEDLDYISSISKDIKSFFIEKHPSFKINFEGLILASSSTILKDDNILVNKLSIKEEIEEDRKKIMTELDSKHFKSIEKSSVRFYKDDKNINIMATRNSKDKVIGWTYILVCEINNRLEYYNSDDKNLKNLELDLNFAREEINKIIKEEAV